jgi:hypothetical protein
MHRLIILSAVVVASSGCTVLQLKRTTIHESETLGDIYQQQVLDNLAQFVHDPDALADFAVPSQGSSQVTDTIAQGSSNLQWIPSEFSMATLGLPEGNRAIQASWTLDPVRDPRKLFLMRCAYQKAVAACGIRASVPFPNRD